MTEFQDFSAKLWQKSERGQNNGRKRQGTFAPGQGYFDWFLRNFNAEFASFTDLAFYADCSVHDFEHVFDNIKSQSCSFYSSVFCSFTAFEGLENFVGVFALYSNSGVLYAYAQKEFTVCINLTHAYRYRTLMCVFYCVAYKIHENLAHLFFIAVKFNRYFIFYADFEFNFFCACPYFGNSFYFL